MDRAHLLTIASTSRRDSQSTLPVSREISRARPSRWALSWSASAVITFRRKPLSAAHGWIADRARLTAVEMSDGVAIGNCAIGELSQGSKLVSVFCIL